MIVLGHLLGRYFKKIDIQFRKYIPGGIKLMSISKPVLQQGKKD